MLSSWALQQCQTLARRGVGAPVVKLRREKHGAIFSSHGIVVPFLVLPQKRVINAEVLEFLVKLKRILLHMHANPSC